MASDSEDDDGIRKAIALSLQGEQGSNVETPIALDDDEGLLRPMNRPTAANSMGLLGLDRKQMEQERLSRKRKASTPIPYAPKSVQVSNFESAIGPGSPRSLLRPPSHSQSTPPLSQTRKDMESSQPLQWGSLGSAKRHKSGDEPIFLHGVVKKTWASSYPPGSDEITLEEVLQKNDLQLALLSSFQWDIPWLLAKINTSETLITLVMQAKDSVTKEQYRRETAAMSNLRICFPQMEGQINCMHSKLMLLSHPKYLRIVVPTANLVNYDWGETGTMENMCFIIDLPRLTGGEHAQKLTFFGEELVSFLKAQGLEKSIVNSLYKFDFSNTKGFAFVHTIGGAHTGSDESWRLTGYCGLGRAVGMLGLQTEEEINVDFVTSSVGSLNLDFLSSIYLACQGDDGTKVFEAKTGGNSKEAQAAKAAQTQAKSRIRQHFRVYFPTYDTVRRSIAGSAGTICFQSKWYNSPTFPKDIMRDCQSTREGMLMHNKLIYVSSPRPWAYIGSANCSESAWGTLSKDRSSKKPKLNCRNWECGVLIPNQLGGPSVRGKEEGDTDGRASSSVRARHHGIVPVPMLYPGAEYGSKKPWYHSEHYIQR